MTGTSPPAQVTLVLGAAAGGMGAHVRTLAAGLAAQGTAVTVAGPPAADTRFSFSALPLVSFSPVAISARPRAGDVAAILRLRGLLGPPRRTVTQAPSPGDGAGPPARCDPAGRPGDGTVRQPAGAPADVSPLVNDGGGHRGDRAVAASGDRPIGGVPGGGHVVHSHGLRAGALTTLALLLIRPRRRPGLVVTVHNAPPAGGAAGLVYRLLEQVAARGANLVLCVSPDLEDRMRAAGARRVERAVIAAPDRLPQVGANAHPAPGAPSGPAAPPSSAAPGQAAPASAGGLAVRADAGVAPEGRPIVLAAGRLAAQKDFGALLEAAAAWRDLDPPPLLVIAGDGPLAGKLRARAAALGVAAVFLGHHDDMSALLAAAAVFVLPSRWEGQPLVLQEALRAGTPVVATRVGGVPGLAGDAALLVPPGDARALADAVRSVLTDAPLATRLRAAAAARAASLPSAADAVTAALDAYSSVPHASRLR